MITTYNTTFTAYIGMGSNLEQPQQQILLATDKLAKLPGCKLLQASRLYRTKPLGPQDQPDFINRVIALETHLDALGLLDKIQAIEYLHGRLRQQHWGPRTLDLDLLLFGNQIINHPRLQVPHPEMTRREFVLYPLAEIAPNLVVPGTELTIAEYKQNLIFELEPQLA